MSSALANRFLHVEMQEDAESWIAWARTHDIHPSVTGFIRYRPGCLFHQEGENLERGWPTPRSWERVSRMLAQFGNGDESLLRKVVYGLVGNRAGVEFMEFHKINETFDDVLEMMTNPEKAIRIPDASDRKYALCAAMTYLLWRGKDEEEEARRVDGDDGRDGGQQARGGIGLRREIVPSSKVQGMGGEARQGSSETGFDICVKDRRSVANVEMLPMLPMPMFSWWNCSF
jgi:hypothetical protein